MGPYDPLLRFVLPDASCRCARLDRARSGVRLAGDSVRDRTALFQGARAPRLGLELWPRPREGLLARSCGSAAARGCGVRPRVWLVSAAHSGALRAFTN